MKKGKINVRIEVERSLWAEVKAKATRENKTAKQAAAELLALGLSTKVKGPE